MSPLRGKCGWVYSRALVYKRVVFAQYTKYKYIYQISNATIKTVINAKTNSTRC